MYADVILGNNLDTLEWVEELQKIGSENIIVIDYEYLGEPVYIEGVLFVSFIEAKRSLMGFDSICFYKTLCVFPGMGGKMSTFFKRNE